MGHIGSNFAWAYLEVGALGDLPDVCKLTPKKADLRQVVAAGYFKDTGHYW